MEHVRFSGIEPLSMILSQIKYFEILEYDALIITIQTCPGKSENLQHFT